MHLNLTQRLFFPILLTSMLVVIIMGVAVRYNFHYGFLEYVNRADARSLEGLVNSLADAHETENSWEFLRGNQSAWLQLLRTHFQLLEHEFRERELHGETVKLMPPGVRIEPRLTLMDKNKNIVIGNLSPNPNGVQLAIKNGENILGWLHMNPSSYLTDAVAIQFEQQQSNSGYWIALICVFLAAGVAMILARHLTVPVKLLVQATRALTAGDYTVRIEETRSGEDDMGRLQKDFNFLANTLEKNEHTRRQWIADISHELRTPLTVLRGEIEALQDGVRECSKENLKSLHLEILHVNQIIEDLYQLSMSDIGALDYKKEDVELSKAMDNAINSYKETLKQHNISLKFDMHSCGATKIFADPKRLHQLFTNFMQNTLRYTNPDGQLEIWCEHADEYVIIHWRDSAPGVNDELLPQLFVRLFRTEQSRSRQTGGAGLGLSICKNIVDAHDGEISVQHSPLGGLWFITKLPTS